MESFSFVREYQPTNQPRQWNLCTSLLGDILEQWFLCHAIKINNIKNESLVACRNKMATKFQSNAILGKCHVNQFGQNCH